MGTGGFVGITSPNTGKQESYRHSILDGGLVPLAIDVLKHGFTLLHVRSPYPASKFSLTAGSLIKFGSSLERARRAEY